MDVMKVVEAHKELAYGPSSSHLPLRKKKWLQDDIQHELLARKTVSSSELMRIFYVPGLKRK